MRPSALHLFLLLLTVTLLTVSAHALPPIQDAEPVPHPDASSWFVQHGDYWFVQLMSGGSAVDCGLAGGCWTCLRNAHRKVECAHGVTAGNATA